MPVNNQIKNQPAWATLVKNEISGSGRLREGNIIEVEFLKKTPRAAFFDLGNFGTGIVYGLELSNAREILRNIKAGDKLPARIENLEGRSGYAELSLAKAGEQKIWSKIQDIQDSGEIIKVRISGANSGGLIADLFGLKAFLPASQLSPEHYPQGTEGDRDKNIEALKRLVEQEFNVKILSANPRNQKIIISERETLNVNLKDLTNQYEAGQVIDGLVSGLADFGAFIRFVDNPQIEGLVPTSEIEHRLVDNPKEALRLNDLVQAKITDIRDGRIFLSLKALKTDPWLDINERYKVGQEIEGVVYKFNPFGAIVNLNDGNQGVIHVSEFGGIDEMRNALEQGKTYQFSVTAIKPEDKRIILKRIKA